MVQPRDEDLAALRQELAQMTLRLEAAERVTSRLQDSSFIRGQIDGTPAWHWPHVTRSPNTGQKYHLIREPFGNASWRDGEPDKANWSDEGAGGIVDYWLELAKGNVSGHYPVNKFGLNYSAGTSAADVWSATGLWVPPTQARIHDIVSSDANDTAAGTGLRTCRVYGLTSWDLAEDSEIITMNGTTNVPTTKSYVGLHRIEPLTWGSVGVTGPNVGTITATAQTDTTVTAQVEPAAGQTQMALLCVPSIQTFYMKRFRASVLPSGPAGEIAGDIMVNTYPEDELGSYVSKYPFARATDGTSTEEEEFDPARKFAGPCIIKVQVTGSAANMDVTAGFDGALVDNPT